jgi:23S rRNA (uracil1939-C5)-methyltransferase
MSKKNLPLFEKVIITDYAAEGKSLARIDGQVVFIDGGVPQDIVDLQVTYKKKSYMEAQVVKIHHYSPLRTAAFCEHFGICGGCKWQNLDYAAQLRYKQQQVVDALERIGKVALPNCETILGSTKTKYYRNKLDYSFSNKRWLTKDEIVFTENQPPLPAKELYALGFHVPGRYDKVLDVKNCYLQPSPSNEIRLALRKLAIENDLTFFDIKNRSGLLRNLIIRTANTGEVMVLVSFYENDRKAITLVMEHLKANFPQITSLLYVYNPKSNETFNDLEVVCYHGKPYLTETMEDLQFRVGAKSFYQTNSAQAYELYKITRDFAQLTGSEVVYDLYTGTGTIANFVAKKSRQVIGIEYVEQAIEDAKVNSQINNITNTLFYAGDMKDLLTPKFLETHPRPDVVITDPPRAGMHEDVVKMLLQIAAPRIVYVSCNPATQARDINWLDEKYAVKRIQPVDMFPHTHHVENVVLLELK